MSPETLAEPEPMARGINTHGYRFQGGLAATDGNWHHPEVATVGDRVKFAREMRRLGCNEVDRLAGYRSAGTTSRIEGGGRARAGNRGDVWTATIERIARALRVRAEWLISGEEPMEILSSNDPCPNRALAAQLARADGIQDDIITAALSGDADPDRTVLSWLRPIIYRQEARLAAVKLEPLRRPLPLQPALLPDPAPKSGPRTTSRPSSRRKRA